MIERINLLIGKQTYGNLYHFLWIYHQEQDSVKIILMLCRKCGSHASIPTFYQFSCNTQIKESSLIPDVSSLSQLQNLSRITLQKFPRFVHLSCELLRIAGHGRVYRLMHPSTRTGTEPAPLDCLFFKQSQSPLLNGGNLGRNKQFRDLSQNVKNSLYPIILVDEMVVLVFQFFSYLHKIESQAF